MKTFLKILAVVVVLLAIAVGGFIYTFDANDYKKEIAGLVGKYLGRPIDITGDIAISLYPSIELQAGNIGIDNPAGFSKKAFASIGQLDVKIKFKPLLRKRLDIENLVLHELVVDLEKNAAGEDNWHSFAGMDEKTHAETGFGFASLTVDAVDIANSSLTWLEADSGKKFVITRVSLSTQAIAEGQPLPLELKAFVKSNQPGYQAAVNVKTKLVFNSDSASFNANDMKLVIKALLPDSKMESVSLAMIANTTIDLERQTAKLQDARIGALGLIASGTLDVENIFSVPTIKGPLKFKTFDAQTLASHLKFDMPVLRNEQSLKKIAVASMFKTDFYGIYLDNLTATIDETAIKGFIHVTGISEPVVRYELEADKFRPQDYMVATEEQQDQIPLPLEFIRSARIEGALKIDTLDVGDVEMSDVQAKASIKDGVMKANPVTMLIGQSEVKAALQLDTNDTPKGQLMARASNIDANDSITPLLKILLGETSLVVEGIASADVNLSARGNSVAELERSATGTISLTMDNAVLQGVDFNHETRNVVQTYAEKHDFSRSRAYTAEFNADTRTEFRDVSAGFDIKNGKLNNKDMTMTADNIIVTGSGNIDFINKKLDYQVTIDMVMDNTQYIRDKLRDHAMLYNVQGAFGTASCKMDMEKYELLVGRMLIQDAKAKRNKRINQGSRSTWANVRSE
ncbi:MAG: AsmA family protein [Gammaproteobacteria bacterium]|nr:AsmA family protein [Gammaproteobacteria bacterium]